MPISSLVSWRTFVRMRASAVFHSDSGVSSGTMAKPAGSECVDARDPSFTAAVSGFSHPATMHRIPSTTGHDGFLIEQTSPITAKLLPFQFCQGPWLNLYWPRRDYAGKIA